jgi:hypothetical protein
MSSRRQAAIGGRTAILAAKHSASSAVCSDTCVYENDVAVEPVQAVVPNYIAKMYMSLVIVAHPFLSARRYGVPSRRDRCLA